MKTRTRVWSLLTLLSTANAAFGAPSGLTTLPRDVKIPVFKGRTLPVHLLPDHAEANTVHVIPTEGIFVNQGVVKSPLSNCGLIREELKISEINTEARVRVAEMLRGAQAEYLKNQDEYKKWVKEFERLNGQLEPYKTAVEQAKEARQETLTQMGEVKADHAAVLDLITVETDATKLAELRKQRDTLEAQMTEVKTTFVKGSADLRKKQRELNLLELELGEARGKRVGIEKTLSVQTDELSKVQEQLDRLQSASDATLKKYSERLGGYTTLTADFAPAEYLAALKKANPGYQFQYVRSATATVDSTIPGTVRSGSPLETQIGSMIRNAKWSDPRTARDPITPPTSILDPKEVTKDPIKLSQQRLAEREGSLVGTKFLSLDLSILGYCALREPESLASEFNGGAADTFKLALYFTYPVQYAIDLKGRYNAYNSLYEMHKVSSSSSWFGLSKKNKQELVRRIAHSRDIDVEVSAPGVELKPEESLALNNLVREQLLYFAAEQHLDKRAIPVLDPGKPGALGANTVGERLMRIPSPWTFWGGLVLSSLGSMFGSSSSETITDIAESSWVSIDYRSGFAMLSSGEITIGDLKRAELKAGNR